MTGEIKTEVKNGVTIYTTKAGYRLTSKYYAEALSEAIGHTKNQMQSTRDARKKRRISEKLQSIELWVSMHPDVRMYMK
jgi:hypothetical protein